MELSRKATNGTIILEVREDYASMNAVIKDRISTYLRYAQEKVPYYQVKFRGLAVSAETMHELPITYSDDLCRNPEAFVAESDKIVQMASTGGTYTNRKLIFRTFEDIQRSVATAEKMFMCSGIGTGDRIAILQPFDLWGVGHIALRAFQGINAFSCPFGISSIDSDLPWFLDKLGLDVIYATPSRITNIAESLPHQGFRLKRILCAGEPIMASHREKVRNAFSCEIFGIYGSEETDGIGAECRYHNGYHVFDDCLVVELLNPATLQPSNSGQGVLVVTKLDYKGTVLIRYLLDDIVEICKPGCQCGAKDRKIRIVGRRSETIFLYDGFKVPVLSIEQAIKQIFSDVPTYQVVVKNTGRESLLRIRVEFEGSEATGEKLVDAIRMSIEELRTEIQSINNVKIEIEFVSDPSCFQFTKRGKLPKIVNG